MKRNLILTSLTIAVCLVASTSSMAQGTSVILTKMQKAYEAMQNLQANVIEESYDPTLQITDTRNGKLKYIPKNAKTKKMYVRLDWASPDERLSIIGDEYRLYRVKAEQVYEGRTSDAKSKAKGSNALRIIGMSGREIKENFTVKWIGEEKIKGGVGTINLELTPKVAADFKVANIWVDGDGYIRMVKILPKAGNILTFFLENAVYNGEINGSDFLVQYPTRIKPIK